jgi:hypothetical protein
MIKANELRIGNWIQGPDGVNRLVENIHQYSFNESLVGDDVIEGCLLSCFSGIPLTPEILEKCGFGLRPNRISIWGNGRVLLWLGHTGAIAYLKKEDTDGGIYIPSSVMNLHQLQNLFYALTGEELPVNL